jgi:hypothetical protein
MNGQIYSFGGADSSASHEPLVSPQRGEVVVIPHPLWGEVLYFSLSYMIVKF